MIIIMVYNELSIGPAYNNLLSLHFALKLAWCNPTPWWSGSVINDGIVCGGYRLWAVVLADHQVGYGGQTRDLIS